jgi:hypothetical protein
LIDRATLSKTDRALLESFLAERHAGSVAETPPEQDNSPDSEP